VRRFVVFAYAALAEVVENRSATGFVRCSFCGGKRLATTREHMPPKSLFDNSYRPDKLVMPACAERNSGTGTADLVASVVSRCNYFSNDQQDADHRKLIARARRQAPDVVEEWTELSNPVEKERAHQHLRNHGMLVPHDAGVVTIAHERFAS
jgi:hypothetical protein